MKEFELKRFEYGAMSTLVALLAFLDHRDSFAWNMTDVLLELSITSRVSSIAIFMEKTKPIFMENKGLEIETSPNDDFGHFWTQDSNATNGIDIFEML